MAKAPKMRKEKRIDYRLRRRMRRTAASLLLITSIVVAAIPVPDVRALDHDTAETLRGLGVTDRQKYTNYPVESFNSDYSAHGDDYISIEKSNPVSGITESTLDNSGTITPVYYTDVTDSGVIIEPIFGLKDGPTGFQLIAKYYETVRNRTEVTIKDNPSMGYEMFPEDAVYEKVLAKYAGVDALEDGTDIPSASKEHLRIYAYPTSDGGDIRYFYTIVPNDAPVSTTSLLSLEDETTELNGVLADEEIEEKPEDSVILEEGLDNPEVQKPEETAKPETEKDKNSIVTDSSNKDLEAPASTDDSKPDGDTGSNDPVKDVFSKENTVEEGTDTDGSKQVDETVTESDAAKTTSTDAETDGSENEHQEVETDTTADSGYTNDSDMLFTESVSLFQATGGTGFKPSDYEISLTDIKRVTNEVNPDDGSISIKDAGSSLGEKDINELCAWFVNNSNVEEKLKDDYKKWLDEKDSGGIPLHTPISGGIDDFYDAGFVYAYDFAPGSIVGDRRLKFSTYFIQLSGNRTLNMFTFRRGTYYTDAGEESVLIPILLPQYNPESQAVQDAGFKKTGEGRNLDDNNLVTRGFAKQIVGICNEAFLGAKYLNNITIDCGNFHYIGDRAFQGVTAIKNVGVSRGIINYVGNKAFEGCDALNSFIFMAPDSSYSDIVIGSEAFSKSGLTGIDLPYTVTIIGAGAFNDCNKLRNVNITGDKVRFKADIKRYAFYDCLALNSISWDTDSSSNITRIGTAAFAVDYNKTGDAMTSFVFPKISDFDMTDGSAGKDELEEKTGTKVLGDYVLAGRKNLQTVKMPDSAWASKGSEVMVPPYTFAECSGLEYVDFSGSTDTIGKNATYNWSLFNDVTTANFYVKGPGTGGNKGVTYNKLDSSGNVTTDSYPNNDSFANPRISTWMAYTRSRDYVPYLYMDGGKEVYEVNMGDYVFSVDDQGNITNCIKSPLADSTGGTLIIPPVVGNRTVTGISTGAIKDDVRTSLSRLIIEDNGSLAEIADSTFANCPKLVYVYLGNSVKSIGDKAFQFAGSETAADNKSAKTVEIVFKSDSVAFRGKPFESKGNPYIFRGELKEGFTPFEYAMDPVSGKINNDGLYICYKTPSPSNLTVMLDLVNDSVPTLVDYPRIESVNMDNKTFIKEEIERWEDYYSDPKFNELRYNYYKDGPNSSYDGPWLSGQTGSITVGGDTVPMSGHSYFGTYLNSIDGFTKEDDFTLYNLADVYENNKNKEKPGYEIKGVPSGAAEAAKSEFRNMLSSFTDTAAYDIFRSINNLDLPAAIKSIDISGFYNFNGLDPIDDKNKRNREAYIPVDTYNLYINTGDDISGNEDDRPSNVHRGLFSGFFKDYADGDPKEERIRGNDSIESITLRGVEKIPDFAFDSCEALNTINLYELKEVGEQPFAGCRNLTTLNVENSDKYKVDPGMGILYEINGVDDYTLVECIPGRYDPTVVNPSEGDVSLQYVTKMMPGAFEECKKLTNIDLSSTSLKEVPVRSFKNCGEIGRISLPSSVYHIRTDAFTYPQYRKTASDGKIYYENKKPITVSVPNISSNIETGAFEMGSDDNGKRDYIETYRGNNALIGYAEEHNINIDFNEKIYIRFEDWNGNHIEGYDIVFDEAGDYSKDIKAKMTPDQQDMSALRLPANMKFVRWKPVLDFSNIQHSETYSPMAIPSGGDDPQPPEEGETVTINFVGTGPDGTTYDSKQEFKYSAATWDADLNDAVAKADAEIIGKIGGGAKRLGEWGPGLRNGVFKSKIVYANFGVGGGGGDDPTPPKEGETVTINYVGIGQDGKTYESKKEFPFSAVNWDADLARVTTEGEEEIIKQIGEGAKRLTDWIPGNWKDGVFKSKTIYATFSKAGGKTDGDTVTVYFIGTYEKNEKISVARNVPVNIDETAARALGSYHADNLNRLLGGGYRLKGNWDKPTWYTNVYDGLEIRGIFEKDPGSNDSKKDDDEDDDDDDGTHSVTVVNGLGSGRYRKGRTVTITANPAGDMQAFDYWSTDSSGVSFEDGGSSVTTFTMPGNSVTVTAHFKDIAGIGAMGYSSDGDGSGGGGGAGAGAGGSGGGGTGSDYTAPQTNARVILDHSAFMNQNLASASVEGSTDDFVVRVSYTQDAEDAVSAALYNKFGDISAIAYTSMDISLYDSTGTVPISDTSGLRINLTLPIPYSQANYGANNRAASVVNGDELEELNGHYNTINDVPVVTFTCTHFSPYTIYVDTNNLVYGTDASPKTGDPIHPKWFLAMGLMGMSILLFMKKDKRPAAQVA